LVEQTRKECEGQPGVLPGTIRKQIDACNGSNYNPVHDVFREASATKRSTKGKEISTYQVPSRRQGCSEVLLRGRRFESPEASIIMDTSGSMKGLESEALDAAAKGLRGVQSPRVIAFDSKMQSCKRMESLNRFEFVGYGGTNMSQAIEQEDKKHRPDAIMVITDGVTPWPKVKPRARVVVVLVEDNEDRFPVPTWAKVINMTSKREVQHVA